MHPSRRRRSAAMFPLAAALLCAGGWLGCSGTSVGTGTDVGASPSSSPSVSPPPEGVAPDAPPPAHPDASTPTPGACSFPFAPSNIDLARVDACAAAGDLKLPGPCVVDTDALTITCVNVITGFTTAHLSQGRGAPEIAVFVARSLSVPAGAQLTTVGSRVAAFLVSGTAAIDGTILVKAGATRPPTGSHPRTGGSFCGKGGDSESGAPADGMYGSADLVPLLGGETAAPGDATSAKGGGGLQISAGVSILVSASGIINAGGQGGSGTQGGGGGGAGGGILLEAPSVTTNGILAANGGGGGGNVFDGKPGQASSAPAPSGFAPLGAGAAGDSARGGNGYYGSGGYDYGGGGGGYVHVNTATAVAGTGLYSPSSASGCATQGPLAH